MARPDEAVAALESQLAEAEHGREAAWAAAQEENAAGMTGAQIPLVVPHVEHLQAAIEPVLEVAAIAVAGHCR